MKKLIVIGFLAGFISLQTFGQSARFTEAMEKNITPLHSARDIDTYVQVANTFERIANAEKTEWLPFYYGAYALVMAGYAEQDASKLDPMLDKADEWISKAESMQPNNSEVTNVKAMIMVARMQADNSRGMTLGPKSSAMFQQAMTQKPTGNPRVMMSLAQNLYYTPEAFGGNKAKAIELMEKALASYDTFKPESPIHPSWGKEYVAQTLAQWKGK